MNALKDCFAVFGVLALGALLTLNVYIAYNMAIGRNVVLQKTVSVMLTEEEERETQRKIVEEKELRKLNAEAKRLALIQ